jgi:hypothetical protein
MVTSGIRREKVKVAPCFLRMVPDSQDPEPTYSGDRKIDCKHQQQDAVLPNILGGDFTEDVRMTKEG